MWKLLFKAVPELFKSWIDLKKAKHTAEAARAMKSVEVEADWDLEALRNSKYSLKDEVIMTIWYSPLVIAWFDSEMAMDWINFVQELPVWYQIGLFGIMAASFGLRWFFKKENLKIGKRDA